MNNLGYMKTFETRILRIKHKCIFRIGCRAVDLKEMLKSVPDDSVIDEVLDFLDGNCASIEFHEERVDKERPHVVKGGEK